VVKRTGDGSIVEFRSVVDAVRCAVEVQSGMIERNAGLPPERRIEFRVGIHVGDVVEESDGDLMGDGVNIAARLEGIAKPGTTCLSEDAYRQVKSRLDLAVSDFGSRASRTSPSWCGSIRCTLARQRRRSLPRRYRKRGRSPRLVGAYYKAKSTRLGFSELNFHTVGLPLQRNNVITEDDFCRVSDRDLDRFALSRPEGKPVIVLVF
jgi:Adenylate and Guanylate cyclase catalytic domain